MYPARARYLRDVRPTHDGSDRVQPLLDDRQDNQRQSRPPRVRAPHGDAAAQSAERGPRRTSPGGRPSRITRRRTPRSLPCLGPL